MSDHTTETQLFVDNDQPLYKLKIAIEKNLARWICREKFDPSKATMAFTRVTREANRRYRREFSQTLPMDDRRQAARDFAEDFQRRVAGIRNRESWAANDTAAEVLEVLKKCL